MNLLENIKSNNTAKGTKQTYSLDEILWVMKQLSDGKTVQDVSALTGRSVHTLRYKFLEGEVVLNGKPVVRSVKKYKTMEELFSDHGAEYLGDDDMCYDCEADWMEQEGLWIDPAGGVHSKEETDPARMYE